MPRLLRRLFDLFVKGTQPGAQFVYSDINFITLGALVEEVSKMTLDNYTQSKIFAPLKMKDTSFVVPKEKLPPLTDDLVRDTLERTRR